MTITSTAFSNNDQIPEEYSLKGGNKNPPLTFSEIPDDAVSLVLVVEDPDALSGAYTHWIIYNMTPAVLQIPENGLPISGEQATNDANTQDYFGPDPPSGTHRYVFRLFALDSVLEDATPEWKRPDIYKAMDEHILDTAEITGLYGKTKA